MDVKAKGVIWANFAYLVMFYVGYFLLVPSMSYVVATIGATPPLDTYYSAIPASTTTMMNFIIYVAVPIMALVWTIVSSTQPQQVYYR